MRVAVSGFLVVAILLSLPSTLRAEPTIATTLEQATSGAQDILVARILGDEYDRLKTGESLPRQAPEEF